MTRLELKEMLNKGKFQLNSKGINVLKSHLELYELIGNIEMMDIIQWYSEKLASEALKKLKMRGDLS